MSNCKWIDSYEVVRELQWLGKKGGVVVVRQGGEQFVAKYSEKHQRSQHNCL